jgi:hypothetical protein
VAAVAAPAEAFTSFVPLAAPDHDRYLAPQPGVATPEDMERVQVKKAWYGHWRRVNRRTVASITGVIITDRGRRRARDRSIGACTHCVPPAQPRRSGPAIWSGARASAASPPSEELPILGLCRLRSSRPRRSRMGEGGAGDNRVCRDNELFEPP